MIKIIGVFIIGFVEQCLYTMYLISVTKRQVILSSILMFVYMSLYLFIVAYALKDSNTIILLISYSIACCFGNFITMIFEKKRIKNVK